ncbi:thioredoxin-like domain-containing protein [Pedobacter sp. 22163]|uniref:thioredoxin-like domain-containing protein n=1 Tax=Pedobacter sp. 22163 TaxID=3453883 RepID=UPI003F835D11
MKRTIISIFMLLPFVVAAQKNYTISGKLTGLKESSKVFLSSINGGRWVNTDSAEVKGGKFFFKGSVDAPKQIILTLKRLKSEEKRYNTDQLAFFVENAKISVIGNDSIKNAKVSGSISEKENSELMTSITPLTDAIISLNNKFYKKPKDEAWKKATDSVNWMVDEIKRRNWKFVASHLNSFMGLYIFNQDILSGSFESAKVDPLFEKFSSELKTSALGDQVAKKMEIGRRRQAGVKVADFTQNDLNGKPFTLSSLRGKYVLVDFWASWCAPCRAENPNVVKAYNSLKNKDFEIVSVSLDANKESWKQAIEKDGMPWIHVSDLKYYKNEVALMFGINSVPQNLLINPQGIIVARNLRGEDLTEKISALMK